MTAVTVMVQEENSCIDVNATLRWTLPPDLLVLDYDDEAFTEDALLPEDVTMGNCCFI
jgi:hypothetical protein